MAIKYVHVPDQAKVVAILENTRYDAVHKIAKIMEADQISVL